jgi:hypothetical protein
VQFVAKFVAPLATGAVSANLRDRFYGARRRWRIELSGCKIDWKARGDIQPTPD